MSQLLLEQPTHTVCIKRDQELQQAHREVILEDEHYRNEFTSINQLLLQVSQITNSIHSECSTSPPPTSDLDLLPGLRELPELDPKAPLEQTLERLLTVAITPLISWLARPEPVPSEIPEKSMVFPWTSGKANGPDATVFDDGDKDKKGWDWFLGDDDDAQMRDQKFDVIFTDIDILDLIYLVHQRFESHPVRKTDALSNCAKTRAKFVRSPCFATKH